MYLSGHYVRVSFFNILLFLLIKKIFLFMNSLFRSMSIWIIGLVLIEGELFLYLLHCLMLFLLDGKVSFLYTFWVATLESIFLIYFFSYRSKKKKLPFYEFLN